MSPFDYLSLFAGLLPILLSAGTGSEVMQRIAAPMVRGVLTAPLASMLLMPVLLKLLYKRVYAASGE